MKNKILITAFSVMALALPAFAISKPTVDPIPSQVDADLYTLKINVTPGAKVTVLGGPTFIPPAPDSDEDGRVEVTVGLAQEQENVFSISSELNGQFSDSTDVTIYETSAGSGQQQGDTTPPNPPVLDDINNPITTASYTLKGSVEADANIYVKNTLGETVATTRATSQGRFEVAVDLEPDKTNRFNVSGEDAAGNIGSATQAVIQAVSPEVPKETQSPEIPSFFPDVPAGHDNREAIAFLKGEEYVAGYPDGTFKPARSVNRAEFTKIIVNAKLGSEPTQSAGDCFPDVKASDWFSSYVCYAKENGIISGYPDGTFGPSNTINLVEASKILVNALGVEQVTPSGDQWYSVYLESLSDLRYLPDTFATLTEEVNRGEMSEMVWRILEEHSDQDYVRFSELQ